MPTLKDIALACGVSVSVVSRALNPNPDQQVAPETKKRIEEAMQRLHYRRNHTASLLRKRRSSAVGIFLPKQHDPLIADLVIGISQVARETDFQCDFYFGLTEEHYLAFFEQVNDTGSSGILTYPPRTDQPLERFFAALERYQRDGGKVLMLNTPEKDYPAIPILNIDDVACGKSAAQHLIAVGCRRLFSLTPAGGSFIQGRRCRGFAAEAETAGLPVPVTEIPYVDFHQYDTAALQGFIRTLPEEPVGIFVTNDYLAYGLLLELHRAGKSNLIGRTIRIVGVDGLFGSHYTQPPLSTFTLPFREFGESAMRWLIAAIVGEPLPPPPSLQPTLIVRESSAGEGRNA